MQLKKISNRMFKIKLSDKEVLKYFGSYDVFASSPYLFRKKAQKIVAIFLKDKSSTFDLEVRAIKDFGAEIVVLKSEKTETEENNKTYAIGFNSKNDFLDFINRINQSKFEIYSYKNTLCLITKSKNLKIPLIKEYSNNFTTDNILISVIKEHGKKLK